MLFLKLDGLLEQFILRNKLGLIRGNIHTKNYVT
jgi:hypothetical protein